MLASVPSRLRPSPTYRLSPGEIGARATDAFELLVGRFRDEGQAVDFDFRHHCAAWTTRGDHYTHRLHRYPGRLTPYIPLFFLGVNGVAVDGGRLLDPFAGCGTVLVEAPAHPVHPMEALGLEINPLARLIAKVKTTAISRQRLLEAWHRIRRRHASDGSRASLSSFPNKHHWFSPVVDRRLAKALRAMDGLRDQDLRDFFLVSLSSTVRDVALADPRVSVPVRIDPARFHSTAVRKRIAGSLAARETADVFAILEATVLSNIARVDSWSRAAAARATSPSIVGSDARTFARGSYVGAGTMGPAEGSIMPHVDLVLTSPPYANAQRYTRSLRLELFVLGFTSNGQEERALDVLQVGTERVPEESWGALLEPTSSATANDVIASVAQDDRYRAAIVGQYVRDMETVMNNCYDHLKADGHAVFVVGNNRIRGRHLDNAEVLAELARDAGFSVKLRLKNKIPSRGLLTKRHPTASMMTHEHVLVLQKR